MVDHKPSAYDWNYKGPAPWNMLPIQWWSSVWPQCHEELLGKSLICGLEILLGYQKTLDPWDVQTLEGERNTRKNKIYEGGREKVCNIRWKHTKVEYFLTYVESILMLK